MRARHPGLACAECRHGIEPIVIHLTFQRWWEAGKVARLREFGLWHLDPPEHYGAPALVAQNASTNGNNGNNMPNGGVVPAAQPTAQRFLTYHNGVLEFIEEVGRRRIAAGDTSEFLLFEKNWLGLAYQMAAFRWVVDFA